MPATLLRHLIFDMHRRHARTLEIANRARDIERPAPADIDVHQQRRIHIVRNPPRINQHIFHRGDAQIRNPARAGRHAAARQIHRLKPALRRQPRKISVHTADHGKRIRLLHSLAETGAGRKLAHDISPFVNF